MDSDAGFSAILPWFLEMIPFNVQTKNRNRVGGVMTPPYENIPSNYNFTTSSGSRWVNVIFHIYHRIFLWKMQMFFSQRP